MENDFPKINIDADPGHSLILLIRVAVLGGIILLVGDTVLNKRNQSHVIYFFHKCVMFILFTSLVLCIFAAYLHWTGGNEYNYYGHIVSTLVQIKYE